MSLENIDKRKNITTIVLQEELIGRGSEIYSFFEDRIMELTQKNGKDDKVMINNNFEEIAYLFSQQCYYRDFIQDYPQGIEDKIPFDESNEMFFDEVYLGTTIGENAANSVKENLKTFSKLDTGLFKYFWSLSEHIYKNEFLEQEEINTPSYKLINNISKADLIRELGSKRMKEIFTDHEMLFDTLEIESFIEELNDEEKGRLAGLLNVRHNKRFNTDFKTYIMNNEKRIYINDTSPQTAMVELDLSKSKKQILKYVEYLIDEYNNEETSFSLMHELLGALDIKKKSMTSFIKTPKDIPLCANLTDYLFAYDCYRCSIPIREILAILNYYYYDFYQNVEESISKSTVDNRLKDIKDYIENKKYTLYYAVEFSNMEMPTEAIIEEAEDRYWAPEYT